MGRNPSILLIGQRRHLDEIFRSLLQLTDSSTRSRVASHLPWQPEGCIKSGNSTIELGVEGLAACRPSIQNYHPFALRMQGTTSPCDLSIYCGQSRVLIELCAATNDAADVFTQELFRPSTVVEKMQACVDLICFDNEHDPWMLMHPSSSHFVIPWTLEELDAYCVALPGYGRVIDIDAFGEVLLEMLSDS